MSSAHVQASIGTAFLGMNCDVRVLKKVRDSHELCFFLSFFLAKPALFPDISQSDLDTSRFLSFPKRRCSYGTNANQFQLPSWQRHSCSSYILSVRRRHLNDLHWNENLDQWVCFSHHAPPLTHGLLAVTLLQCHFWPGTGRSEGQVSKPFVWLRVRKW